MLRSNPFRVALGFASVGLMAFLVPCANGRLISLATTRPVYSAVYACRGLPAFEWANRETSLYIPQERCRKLKRVAAEAQAPAVIDERDPLLSRLRDLLGSEKGEEAVSRRVGRVLGKQKVASSP